MRHLRPSTIIYRLAPSIGNHISLQIERSMASVQNIRKAIGAIKDSTMVGLANFSGDNKMLDIAIVKATNHDEFVPKEKHIRRLFIALSGASPRTDVIYCLRGLEKRLAKTRTWTVALKVLLVIHRALREVGPTFQQELLAYCHGKGLMLNLSNFKDDSSQKAWDYSAWICAYAMYLEERLESFRVLKYDVQMDNSNRVLDTPNLLKQLPVLQSLINRVLTCRPVGAASNNALIHFPLSIVAGESVRLYITIADGIRNLVEKYFGMQRHDAIRTLELYRKSASQAEKLTEFFQICRALAYGRSQRFVKVERPPASFIGTMEEYVKNAPQTLVLRTTEIDSNEDNASNGIYTSKVTVTHEAMSKVIVTHEGKVQNSRKGSETSSSAYKGGQSSVLTADLLCMDDIIQTKSETRDTNPLALQVVHNGNSTESLNSLDMADPNNWELALVTVPSTNEQTKSGGVLDKFTLDSLYDAAMTGITNQNANGNMGLMSSNPSVNNVYCNKDPFYGYGHQAGLGMQKPNIMQQQQQQASFIQW
ncbi:hypothetical protein ACFE04_008217 [Oxalis oulophora]